MILVRYTCIANDRQDCRHSVRAASHHPSAFSHTPCVTRVYFGYENLTFLLRSLMRRTQRHDQKKNEKRDRKLGGVDGRGAPRPGGTLEVGLKIFDPEFDPPKVLHGLTGP